MPESASIHAYGASVEISEDGSTGWTGIAEVVDATPPEWLVKDAKATHLLSLDEMTENKPGIGDTGKGMLTLNYTPAQLTTFLGYFRTAIYWRFKFPLDEGETTPAIIGPIHAFWSKIGPGKFDPEDANVIQKTVEFTRVAGRPVFTQGS